MQLSDNGNKLIRAAKLLENEPESGAIYRVKSVFEVNKHCEKTPVLFDTFHL